MSGSCWFPVHATLAYRMMSKSVFCSCRLFGRKILAYLLILTVVIKNRLVSTIFQVMLLSMLKLDWKTLLNNFLMNFNPNVHIHSLNIENKLHHMFIFLKSEKLEKQKLNFLRNLKFHSKMLAEEFHTASFTFSPTALNVCYKHEYISFCPFTDWSSTEQNSADPHSAQKHSSIRTQHP